MTNPKIDITKVERTVAGHEVIRIDYYHDNPDYARLLVQIHDGFQVESHAYFDNGEYWKGEPSGMDLIEGT